ncbi:zinc dependent phospholipase C family protein, partial [Vallitalea guaymasensis]|uniref:zinc dependent phospholipase C family protein n=1 Tax=Vallitalea guaymasensis TaxID=1185412 RepID=UPI00272C2C1D
MKNILKKVSVFTIAVALMMELISTSVLGWAGELDQDPNTHTLLVTQALQILENDLTSEDKNDSEFMDVINRLKASIEDFKRGAIMPDFDDKNFSLYQDHFYNPYTKTNFTASNEGELAFLDFVYQTAEYRSKEYIGWALQYWKSGDYNNAIYTLGNAMHYFADLCNPHHASNAIGGTQEHITKHSTFETYVENTKDQYT